MPAVHSPSTSSSPLSLPAQPGPPLPRPMVLRARTAGKEQRGTDRRGGAEHQAQIPRGGYRAGVAGSSLWHFLRSPVWNGLRLYLLVLSRERKTNSKMSKIKQAWYFTVAETMKMN